MLVNQHRADVAHAACDHDRLVITLEFIAVAAGRGLLKAAKIPGQIGPAEFIIKSRAAQGAFQHNCQGRGDTLRLAVFLFPGLQKIRDF